MCLLPFQFFVSHNLSSWYNVYFWTFSCSFVDNDSTTVQKSVNNVAFFCITNEFIMTAFITTTSFQLPRQRNDHFSSFQGFCRKGKAYRYEKTFDLKPQIWDCKKWYKIATIVRNHKDLLYEIGNHETSSILKHLSSTINLEWGSFLV